jgi:hypothetical protein
MQAHPAYRCDDSGCSNRSRTRPREGRVLWLLSTPADPRGLPGLLRDRVRSCGGLPLRRVVDDRFRPPSIEAAPASSRSRDEAAGDHRLLHVTPTACNGRGCGRNFDRRDFAVQLRVLSIARHRAEHRGSMGGAPVKRLVETRAGLGRCDGSCAGSQLDHHAPCALLGVSTLAIRKRPMGRD